MQLARSFLLVSVTATVTALLALSACGGSAAPRGGRDGGASEGTTASAPPAKQRPAGAGGLLSGGVWMIQAVTIGGREETLPSEARPWIALVDDGTASGSYGCTPFHAKSEVTATRLTLGEAVAPLPAPSLPPAAPEGGPGPCHPDDVARTPPLADFEKKVKAVFGGEVSPSTERFGGYTKLHVKNRLGDDITLAQARRDDITLAQARRDDFTAEAAFAGVHVSFHDPVLTTRRTCGTNVMEEEASVLATLKKSLNYWYSAESEGSLSLQDGLAYPAIEHGFTFSAIPRR
ncbi:META domain-containing protein [Streptomyces sp. DB-54]